MRADTRRSIGTAAAALLVLILSGCAALIPPKYRNAPGAKSPSAQITSTYRTTHCTDSGVFRCSSSSWLSGLPVPQVGACGERAQSAILNPAQGPANCQVRLTMWVAVPVGRLMEGAEACAEPLLNFRITDDPSRTIGSGPRVAGILHQASHPALVAPSDESDESVGTSCATVWR
jgi:hypothetical protein